MNNASELIAELHALGLHFVIGSKDPFIRSRLAPATLLAGLAQQTDGRLEMALIALFLYRPIFAEEVTEALRQLNEKEQIKLKLFYTAAMLLQKIHAKRLQLLCPFSPLPDLFSLELALTPSPAKPSLQKLAARHRLLSGWSLNWLGTYQYAAKRLITRLEKEAEWATC
jgi:hypothetical protein